MQLRSPTFYFLRLCLYYEYSLPLRRTSSLSLRVDGCARRPSPPARGSYGLLLGCTTRSQA